jgi:hypothetical protein
MTYLIVFGIIGAIVIVVIGIVQKRRQNESNLHLENKLEDFKRNAKKIKVDLGTAEIKSNSWSEEIVTDNSKSGGLNQMTGDGHRNIQTIQQNKNVMLFKVPYQNGIIEVVSEINMDTKTLEMKLALQNETILYVNPNKTEEYYLDLEFI